MSDSTVREYRPSARRHRRDQTWKTFLHNHADEFISVDFFTVPTVTFRVLYVFLVLSHQRRKILHFNVTDSPSAAWTAQQLTESLAYSHPPPTCFGTVMVFMACSFKREPSLWVWSKSLLPLVAPGKILWSNG